MNRNAQITVFKINYSGRLIWRKQMGGNRLRIRGIHLCAVESQLYTGFIPVKAYCNSFHWLVPLLSMLVISKISWCHLWLIYKPPCLALHHMYSISARIYVFLPGKVADNYCAVYQYFTSNTHTKKDIKNIKIIFSGLR